MRDKKQFNLINLNNYTRKVKDYFRFKKDIFQKLGRRLFEIQDLDLIYFEILKSIDQTKGVKYNSDSIKTNSQILLNHFGYTEKNKWTTLQNMTIGKTTILKGEEISINIIFDFQYTPYEKLIPIRKEVESDLKYFNTLIKHYEQLSEIQELGENQVRYSGRKAAIIPFYKRCLEERNEILEYYLNGMYKRALELSTRASYENKIVSIFAADLFYQPYRFKTSAGKIIRNHDYRDIDVVTHRIEFPARETDISEIKEKFTDIYNSDKKLFYKRYFVDSEIEILFNEINQTTDKLPFSKQRGDIIKQLEKYFKAKEWLAFYAICLPQVEGLFSELLKIENKKTKGIPSLSINVRSVRSWVTEFRERTLDYFEYILPESRNKFSHGNLEVLENLEVNSYDLLMDLYAVLKLFSEIEIPSVKLKSMIKGLDLHYHYHELFSFTDYFKCHFEVNESLRKELSSEIDNFDREFIIPSMEMIKQKVSESIEQYKESKEQFNSQLEDLNVPILGNFNKKVLDNNLISYAQNLHMQNLNLFAYFSELNDFFHYFNKYKKRFEEKYLVEECEFWKSEGTIIYDIKHFEKLTEEKKAIR